MELVEPNAKYKDSYVAAVKEFQRETELNDRILGYRALSIPELENDFEAYVEKVRSHARGENLPEGYVPVSDYWLVDGDEYIGRASVRHRLSENLLKIGGHIGYEIRPSKRRLGYGTAILRLALKKAKELGIERALVTCDEANLGSRKVIENNGGVLENSVVHPETGSARLRFWIDTATA